MRPFTFNLTMTPCKFSTVLLCVIKLPTRSYFKFCLLVNVFKIASCGSWLLAVSWHAVQYLQQVVIIYCTDHHSSQCCNWKLYWSCKYSTLFFAVTGGNPHLAHYRHYSPSLLSSRGSVTQTTPKLAMENNKRKWDAIEKETFCFMHKFCSCCTAWLIAAEGR